MIKKAVFLQSSPDLKSCPLPTLPEFAFIGRSNVGKSSLINMLANCRHLAKTSSVPGKTAHIVFFTVDDTWRLVDLPGYGYAKVSKTMRGQFSEAILKYVFKRDVLHCLFVLIDARLEPQAIDLAFIDKLGESGVPFALVFTKTDKCTQRVWHKNVEVFQEKMLESWETLPPCFYTSAKTSLGREELIQFIEQSL